MVKNKMRLTTIILLFVFSFIVIYSTISSVGFDFKTKIIEKKVIKELNSKYNIDSSVLFVDKEKETPCALWVDTCLIPGIKTYTNYHFIGKDENGNKFLVNYRDTLIKSNNGGINNLSLGLDDNYNLYKEAEKIKAFIEYYYNDYDIIFYPLDEIYGGYFEVIIYNEEINPRIIYEINNKSLTLKKDYFDLIFTTDEELYNSITGYTKEDLKKWIGWRHDKLESSGYISIKDESNANILSITVDNVDSKYTLFIRNNNGRVNNYNLYEKQ